MPAVKESPAQPIAAPEAPKRDHVADALNRQAVTNLMIKDEIAASRSAQSALAESIKTALADALASRPTPATELEIKFTRDPSTDKLAGMKVKIIR